MQRLEIPSFLGSRFRTADALDAGVTRSRLRGADIRHPFRGVCALDLETAMVEASAHYGAHELEHISRALDYAAHMGPYVFFSHVTAAILRRLPLPLWAVLDAPIHVAVFEPGRLPRGKGVRGHQTSTRLASFQTDPETGLRIASPATTWAMSASYLRQLADVVAVGDAAVRTWRVDEPLTTIAQLERAMDAGRRVGVGMLRAALPLLRTGSASRQETHVRLLLIDGGCGEPHLNYDIFADGVRLGAVDFAYPALKIAIEYEGEHHLRSADQWDHDIDRYNAMRAAGWIVIHVTKVKLYSNPEAIVAEVRRALASR